MASELQRLVESLGNRLHRSVAVDDPELHLLAYNPHVNDVDPARTVSILKRSVPREVVDFVYERGAGTATDLFTVPARPDLGLEIARIGMPVHHHGALLGFVWLLASDGPVSEEHTDAVRQAAETVALIMHREYLIGELSRGRERELTRDLLAEQVEVRARAADQLIAENLFASGPVLALVVTLTRAGGLSDEDRLALTAGIEFGRKQRAQRHALTLERPDHTILILTDEGRSARQSLSELGGAVRERVLAETHAGASCWVGIGSAQPALADAHISYAEALRSAEVARVVGVLGAVVHRGELGVYGMLAELPAERLAEGMHPGVRALLGQGLMGDGSLLVTIETFLNNAGDVKRTSDALRIHRSSLYYRLKRVEEITDLDLSVGDDRLALHLGLKISRLIDAR